MKCDSNQERAEEDQRETGFALALGSVDSANATHMVRSDPAKAAARNREQSMDHMHTLRQIKRLIRPASLPQIPQPPHFIQPIAPLPFGESLDGTDKS